MAWIGLTGLRGKGTSGGLLCIRYSTFGFHEMVGSSRMAVQLMAPQVGLSSASK
jgi:hypothetical protein